MENLDMKDEKKPNRKRLLPEGWRNLLIVGCGEEVKSKKGNNQYIIRIRDVETGYEEDLYAVSEPKKRWFLKEVLDACGIEHQDGIYKFEPPLSKNLVGKEIAGLFEHEQNKYINRDGEEVETTQHRIIEVKEAEVKGWDDDAPSLTERDKK